jgi:hypothetical protein
MFLHPIPLNFLIYEDNFVFFLSVYNKEGAGTVASMRFEITVFYTSCHTDNKDLKNQVDSEVTNVNSLCRTFYTGTILRGWLVYVGKQ